MTFYLWLLGFSRGGLLTELHALSPLLIHELLRTNSSLSPNPAVPLQLRLLSVPPGLCVPLITVVMAV